MTYPHTLVKVNVMEGVLYKSLLSLVDCVRGEGKSAVLPDELVIFTQQPRFEFNSINGAREFNEPHQH